jgi:hypothetical protein
LIQENAKRGRTDLGSIVAVWFILEKETADRKALLQSFAARWLSGHLLLPGNLLTLSICGCNCVLVVNSAHSSSMIKHAEQLDNKKVEVQVIETGAIAAAKVSPFVEEPVRYSALGHFSDQIRRIK